MNRRVGIALTLIAVLYVAQGLYYARVLVPVHDAVQYLLVGSKVVRGEIHLYDDRLPGNRVPLPFYVLGLSQVLAGGPSLLAARLLNVGLGLLTLLLTAALARRLAGAAAAILAALFLATQGVVVAYYSYEGYPAFAAFCFTGGLYVLLGNDSRARRLLGAALIGLLFLIRSNLWPAIPFLVIYALWKARGLAERFLLVVLAGLPAVVFFAWDPRHLKLLAYVPVLRRLVAPLGYVSALVLDDRQTQPLVGQLWEVARLARRYEFWVLASVVLVALLLWRSRIGRPAPRWAGNPKVLLLAGLFAYLLLAQFLIFTWSWKWVGLYFLSFAPLVPILLGTGFSGLLAATLPRSWGRRLLAVVLTCLLLPPLFFVRNPLLPIGELRARDPFAAAHRAAAHLARVVPSDARVFFFGMNPVYYLSGLPHTYLQQVYMWDQFPRIQVEDWVARRSGFVPPSDMRDWLSSDATYAVIDLALVQQQRATAGPGAPENEMMALVARHFELIDTVAEYPYTTYAVYRRKASDGRRAGGTARIATRGARAELLRPGPVCLGFLIYESGPRDRPPTLPQEA